MLTIITVAGARPNFMKVAPLCRAFSQLPNIKNKLCHTGQHFDEKMSKTFFDELSLPEPDYFLGINGGSHAVQTAKIMIEFEQILIKDQPDLLIVVGDVNSTLACSLTAAKLGIKIAHVEAGLRSNDRTMPEEINRIVTDSISDFLFVSEESGLMHLKNEGADPSKIFHVGNVMIDTLAHLLPKINKSTILSQLNVEKGKYILSTFHRPSNVDDEKYLQNLLSFFNNLSELATVIFPIHPRTKANLEKYGLLAQLKEKVLLLPPIGYVDFTALQKNACMIITDSGGVQEESTWLGVPCITVRNNTERPVTVLKGTNILAGTDLSVVLSEAQKIYNGQIKNGEKPQLWDGKTAERIIKILVQKLT